MESEVHAERGYLAALGYRVREARARRGTSRKLLARDSEVSERYLFFFSSRRRHTRLVSDWSSDVCSSDLDFRWRVLHIGVDRHQDATARRLDTGPQRRRLSRVVGEAQSAKPRITVAKIVQCLDRKSVV